MGLQERFWKTSAYFLMIPWFSVKPCLRFREKSGLRPCQSNRQRVLRKRGKPQRSYAASRPLPEVFPFLHRWFHYNRLSWNRQAEFSLSCRDFYGEVPLMTGIIKTVKRSCRSAETARECERMGAVIMIIRGNADRALREGILQGFLPGTQREKK